LAAAFLVVVELDILEAAELRDLLIRTVRAMGLAITKIVLLDAVTVSTGPLTLWIATALLAVVEAVSSEATEFVTFIRFIGALGFTVTVVIVVNTLTVGASELSLRVAAAFLDIVEVETSEAAVLVTIIRSISTLLFTITKSRFGDAVARGACELRLFETTTEFVVIEWEALVATLFVTFIRFISTLSFTITKVGGLDAVTVGTGPFGLWVAAAFLVVIEIMSEEATLFVTFIRFIGALGFTVAVTVLVDTITVVALPLVFLAAAFLVVVEWKVSEATSLVTFISTIFALSFTVTILSVEEALTSFFST
jgi:hypothetical protein